MAIDDGRKLFVAGLPDSITEDVLRQLFEAAGGTVVEVSVPRDRATGRPRGFAFVTLATEDQANLARDSLDNSMQSGRSISVRPFQSAPPKRGEVRDRPAGGFDRRDRAERPDRGERPDRDDRGPSPGPRAADDRTLYLGNLPYEASSADVEGLLDNAGVGPVVRVTLPLDADGRARGFGFVTLGSAEAAQAAVDALSSAELRGRRLSASIARGRGERGPSPGGPRPMRPGPPRDGYSPRSDDPPAFRDRGPPPMDAPFGPPPGDENRRGADGRRRKDATKKKKKATGKPGAEREEGRRGADRSRGRRGRWEDDADDY